MSALPVDISKDSFDVALLPGARARLADIYDSLRQREQEVFQSVLDSNGEFREGISHVRDCPLCSAPSADALLIYHTNGMHILQCAVCDLVYSKEVINSNADLSRYRRSTAMDAHLALHANGVYADLETAKARYIVARLKAAGAIIGTTVLDIGCSTGSVLNAATEVGWRAMGIDLNAKAVEMARANGLDALCGKFPDDLPGGTQFGAITMLDVLEHAEKPVELLEDVVERLTQDGLLAIQVPNFNSLLIRIEGSRNNNICHGHWSYFTPQSLRKVARRAGLEVLSIETIISEIDRIRNYPPERVVAAAVELADCEIAFSRIDHKWVHDRLLGYKLLGVFRRAGA